jgi:broad specificity phosphatase PhoE
MLKIYVARHGQNKDNAAGILNGHRDEPLTDIGIAQAREIALKIQDTKLVFDAVYTSPLQRAHKTATIITDTLSLPSPVIISELIERNFGTMTGKPQDMIAALCEPAIVHAGVVTYFLQAEGAETFPDLLQRAHILLNRITSEHKHGNILLVSHGDFGKMLYAAYYGLPWLDVLKLFHFGNSDLLELSAKSTYAETHMHTVTQYNS